MKQKTVAIIKNVFTFLQAVAIVCSPHTFVAKLGQVITAIKTTKKK